MSRTVFCRKFQKEMAGLDKPPFPGPAGEEIYQNVSMEAWLAWVELQTMLINEKHLATSDPEARKWLSEQREKFLSGGDYERPAGYIPPP